MGIIAAVAYGWTSCPNQSLTHRNYRRSLFQFIFFNVLAQSHLRTSARIVYTAVHTDCNICAFLHDSAGGGEDETIWIQVTFHAATINSLYCYVLYFFLADLNGLTRFTVPWDVRAISVNSIHVVLLFSLWSVWEYWDYNSILLMCSSFDPERSLSHFLELSP